MFTDDFASASHACAAVPPVVRRSKTYEVEVFDQIPALKTVDRVFFSTAAGRKLDRTKWHKALQGMVTDVAVWRLHHAAEVMLEFGDDQNEKKEEKTS